MEVYPRHGDPHGSIPSDVPAQGDQARADGRCWGQHSNSEGTTIMTSGTVRLADDLEFTRIGFGAIHLAGPMAWGPPRDPEAAKQLLRTVVELGINHIDTSDYYGPHSVNELIHDALHPYPQGLHLVTKVGATRGPDKSWPAAIDHASLVQAVHDNIEHLGVDSLDVVNLRMTDTLVADDIAKPFTVLAELQEAGLIRHLGVSNVGVEQVAVARRIAPVVTVQNAYNVVMRGDDELVDYCAHEGISFVPFFPLKGFTPEETAKLEEIALSLDLTRSQLALAWLLHRSPTIVVIPGTSSVDHLRENVSAGKVVLDDATLDRLDALGTSRRGNPWAR
jgi:pyridoxine 4-dehydrogenase